MGYGNFAVGIYEERCVVCDCFVKPRQKCV